MKTEFKGHLLEGKSITFHNSFDGEGDLFNVWFEKRWGHFNLMKNGVVIKSVKTLKPIVQKLQFDNVIDELTEISE
jgi:hypothetical protein